ncbi:unnamed protein product [Mytilus edulis]|uniref:FZ domain-containing protein n=1 Tax=Mytilus edulis TaxID=6550 RepID=A0A8S3SEV5_MYTED|nr:unnamed protein product [Mytilus edulis]
MRLLIVISAFIVVSKSCEQIRSPLCQTGVGYNLTIFPNLAGHLFQGGAIVGLQNIRALIDQKCSPNIREFLCRVYIPECYQGKPVLPSWEMCQEAYEGCHQLMSSLGQSWSFSLNCSKFEQSTIDSIKTKSKDNTEFWFGTGVNKLCNAPHATIACKRNIHKGHMDSIVARFNGNLDTSQVDRLMQINYTYSAEHITSCFNPYSMPGGSFQVDPLSPAVHHPWEVRNTPTITWTANPSQYYTLVLVDAGMGGNAYAVFINIRGNDFARHEAVVDYRAPMNPTEVDNPYVFLLYEQTGRISATGSLIQNLTSNTVAALHANSHFRGPKAISWVRIKQDPYSITYLGSRSVVNNCPSLVSEALHHHPASFIPSNTILDMSVDVTYTPSSISFISCCKTYVYNEKSFSINPIGNSTVKTAHVRSSAIPSVSLSKRDWYPEAIQFADNELYTLMMVDPDAGSSPYLHWLVLNIPKGNVNDGVSVREYKGPAPPSGVHTYYFLLYKQTAKINPSVIGNYTTSCSRCGFKISNFVSNNHLELKGASWMLSSHDEYVRHLHVDESSKDRTQVCSGQSGFPASCTSVGSSVTVG